MKTLIGKRHLVALTAAALVALTSLAGTAGATPGNYLAPTTGCSNTSSVLSMTASADAQSGFTTQWITAQFAFRNIDTGASFTYTPWRNFQNTYRTINSGLYPMSSSVPGSTTLSYTVARGHYVVFARYMWWSGSAWTDRTPWVRADSNGYDMVVSGVNFPTYLNTCPVGL